MYLKDIIEGQLVAYEKGYSSVCRARIEKVTRRRGAWSTITISYGRKFEHSEVLSSWEADSKLLGTWEQYREEKKARQELNKRKSELEDRVQKALGKSGILCRVTDETLILRGDIKELEILALDLEDAATNRIKRSTRKSALTDLFE